MLRKVTGSPPTPRCSLIARALTSIPAPSIHVPQCHNSRPQRRASAFHCRAPSRYRRDPMRPAWLTSLRSHFDVRSRSFARALDRGTPCAPPGSLATLTLRCSLRSFARDYLRDDPLHCASCRFVLERGSGKAWRAHKSLDRSGARRPCASRRQCLFSGLRRAFCRMRWFQGSRTTPPPPHHRRSNPRHRPLHVRTPSPTPTPRRRPTSTAPAAAAVAPPAGRGRGAGTPPAPRPAPPAVMPAPPAPIVSSTIPTPDPRTGSRRAIGIPARSSGICSRVTMTPHERKSRGLHSDLAFTGKYAIKATSQRLPI